MMEIYWFGGFYDRYNGKYCRLKDLVISRMVLKRLNKLKLLQIYSVYLDLVSDRLFLSNPGWKSESPSCLS